MDFSQEYNKMRPYHDSEVVDAIARLVKNKSLPVVLSFLYPDRNLDEIIREFEGIKTIREFQMFFSYHAVNAIIKKTSDGLTYSGLENIDRTKPCLFIANHRDIVLDSAIMQSILVTNNIETTQITTGDNLMSSDFIIDLGKLNKMFSFYRGGSKIQLYRNALLHSEYIHHVICNEKQSMWIAQRDGRTKNGDDKTQIALIKMLTMGKTNVKSALIDLNIIPVSVSYEYEPCDAEKVNETYHLKNGEYKKAQNEDFNSILSGIKRYKGHIHMAFGRPLNTALNEQYGDTDPDQNELYCFVINEIDSQIHKNFALWPFNYIASDIMSNTNTYENKKYTQKQKDEFIHYLDKKLEPLTGDKEILKEQFIGLYATPVINANRALQSNNENC